MDERPEEFGVGLRACRQSVGLSQQELAERSGLSIRAISNLERGRTRWPYRNSLYRLADALGLRDATRAEFIAAAQRRLGGEEATPAAGARQGQGRRAAPRYLPATVPGFAGRDDELAALSRMLEQPGGITLITAIGGTAGVGKTALAVHWAHQVAGEFPDGQLFVNLHGFAPSGTPLTPGEAVRVFLDTLQVPADRLPQTVEAQVGLYRSLLAGKRMLIVLDNARDAAQVRPLLPGSLTCRVVVTSRNLLSGLAVTADARLLPLKTMTHAESLKLLRSRLGDSRVASDEAAANRIITACARLPLALCIVSARAQLRLDLPLARIAADLAGQPSLDAFTDRVDPTADVRAAISWSYQQLDCGAARVFRLAGLHPGPDLEPYAVAVLTGATPEAAGRALDALTRAGMLAATGRDRYDMHDLLRAYAGERAAQDGEAERRAALSSLFEHYLRTAAVAMDLLFPAETSRRPRIPAPDGPAPPLSDAGQALAWLEAERANLVAAVTVAASDGWPDHAFKLTATMYRYLDVHLYFPDATTVHSSVLQAARATGDQAAEANALTRLGFVDWQVGRLAQAARCQRQALALYRAVGDTLGQAGTLNRLGLAERSLGRLTEAARCFRQELALCLRTGDRLGETKAVYNLGAVESRQGRFRLATIHLSRALELFTQAGDRLGLAVAATALGVIDLRMGRLTQAAQRFEQAITLCQQTGNRRGAGEAVSQLGMVLLRQGHHEEAMRHQLTVLELFRESGDPSGQAEILSRLGAAETQTGSYRRAADHLEAALALSREIGAPTTETTVLNRLGDLLLAIGDPDQARGRHAEALEIAARTGDRDEQAHAHRGLADACYALGSQDEQAIHHQREALALYSRLGAPEAESPVAFTRRA
jgi:tetratricopeptide (TPR) repeat protein/transcriptional regulator with XRE-family HTH domain